MSAGLLDRPGPETVRSAPAGPARWGIKGTLAVVDQGLTSLAGLVANLLLARWLVPEAYGAFAIGFTALLLASSVHASLVLEPMSVLGPARHPETLRAYLRTQVTAIHPRVALPGGAFLLVLGGAATSLGHGDLGSGIIGAGIAMPALLWLWTARRSAYVLGAPGAAAAGSGVSLGLTVAGLSLLGLVGHAGPVAAFGTIAVASICGTFVVLRASRPTSGEHRAVLPWRGPLAEQWAYGRWMLAASVLIVAGTQGQTVLVAGAVGLEGAAILRAMLLPMLPLAQAIVALAMLALPVFSADAGRGDIAGLRRKAMLLSAGLAGAALVFELLLVAVHVPLERVLFGGKFAPEAGLIPLLGIVPVLTGLTTGFALALRAIQRPQHQLIVAAFVAPAGLGSAWYLSSIWGTAGAAAGIVIAYAISAVVTITLYRAWVVRGDARASR